MKSFFYKNQTGAIFPMILGAMFIIGCIATIGTSLYTSMAGGMQKTSNNIKIIQTLNLSADVLMSESTRNSAGYPIVPVFITGSVNPVNGGIIPGVSNAPKNDYLGNYIGYCTQNPTDQTTVVFALISPGPNKTFDTTCSQALSGLMINDDVVVTKTSSAILQAVSGRNNYAEPVTNEADLGNLTTVSKGELRLVLSTVTLWTNVTGVSGMSNWKKALLATPPSTDPMPVLIKDPFTACTPTTDSGTNSAKEGFAISTDRLFLFVCGPNGWQRTRVSGTSSSAS